MLHADGVRPGVPRAKTAVPRLAPRHQSRERLLRLLDAGGPEQVTVLSAPAGYGKTQLLAEWAQARGPFAWVSLDEDDNDDHRFWSSVLTAVGAVPGSPDRLRRLPVPGRPSADPEFLAAVGHAFDEVAEPVRLVLDDVHELTAPGPLHGLAVLVRDRSPQVRLVLSGRTDPRLPVARMRLTGELAEVRARELRFSLAEAEAVLAAEAVVVRPDQVRLLVEQTEGWPAGLRLATVSLRDAPDADRFLADLAGNGRAVSDYLVGEILSRLAPDVLDLLRAVSICDQLPAGLAAVLAGRQDAGDVLDVLEHETALVDSAGDGRVRYRIHPLLRAHLRADLQRRRPDHAAVLHARAADWFAGRHRPVHALGHARLAGDAGQVALLLRQQALPLLADGRHGVVRGALEWLAEAGHHGGPWFDLVGALAVLESGSPAEADALLAHAAAGWPDNPPPDLTALRDLVRSRRTSLTGEPGEMVRTSALLLPPPDGAGDDELVPMARLDRALALLAAGRAADGRALAEGVLATARQQHQRYLAARALAVLAGVAGVEGDYPRMVVLAERAAAEATSSEWDGSAAAALVSSMRAYGALLRADPAACLALTGPAEAPGAVGDGLVPLRRALRGAALVDLGRGPEGVAELQAAQAAAEGADGAPQLLAAVAVLAHGGATLLGRVDLARAVLGWADRVLGHAGEVRLMHARRLAAMGRLQPAADALRPVLTGDVPVLLPWTLVECRVLACHAALHAEQRATARRDLRTVLAEAASDVLRPLAFGPVEVVDLLIRQLGSFGDLEPAAGRVLAARHAVAAGSRPVRLTGRERDVLVLLPTQRSLEEIADELGVSHSTVKTHVKAIYAKLDARSRREAVTAARRHGLLSTPPP